MNFVASLQIAAASKALVFGAMYITMIRYTLPKSIREAADAQSSPGTRHSR